MRSTILVLVLCGTSLGCAGSAGSAGRGDPAPACPPAETRGTESFAVRAAAVADGPLDGTQGAVFVRVSLGTAERPPRPGAFVDLWRQPPGARPLRSGTTGGTGTREGRGLPAGEYRLVVSAVGSDSVGRTVTVRTGYTDTLDVALDESTICLTTDRRE
jgi:hypothetical protein